MHHIHNLAKINSFLKGGTARSDIEKYLLPNAKLYLKDFGTSIDFANNTITNFGYGLNNLAMVGYTRNDGTVSGGVTIVDGAIQLNNTTDRVTTPNIMPDIKTTGASVTIRFTQTQIETTNVLSDSPRIWGSSATSNRRYYLYLRNSLLQFRTVDAPDRNISTTQKTGLQCVTITFDVSDSRTRLYRDDEAVVQSTIYAGGFGDWSSTALTLGQVDAITQAGMKVHGFMVYNRTLSQAEHTTIFQAGPNAYSPISSGLVAQYSGRNFAGTTSAPTTIFDTRYITQVSATDTRTVLNNLGAQYINYGGVMFSASDSYSVLANYRLDSTATAQRIISRMTGSNTDVRQPTLFANDGGSVRRALRNTVPTDYNLSFATATGWQQTSAFYNQDTGDLGLYKNAILEDSDSFTGTMQSSTENTMLFAQTASTSDENLNAGLQSLMVIDKEITATQYKQWYNYVRV